MGNVFFDEVEREVEREVQRDFISRWGIPQTPFFIRASPCGGYHEGAHRAIALAGGVPQTPFSSGRRPVGDTPKPRRRALPCVLFEKNQKGLSFSSARRKELKEASTLTNLHPRFRRPLERGSKRERETTNAQKLQAGRELNRGDDKHRKSIKREGSSKRETTSTAKASSGKGAQFADYAKRWSVKGI